MTHPGARTPVATAGACLLAWVIAGCGSDGSALTTPAPATPSSAATGPPATAVPGGTTPPPAANVMGPGPLSAAQVRTLITDFENRLAQAYAAGDTSHLGEFLAGPELSGNVATINVNNNHHARNIFHVEFNSLTITSNSAERVVFNLVDHTTDNHYVDTTTNQTTNGGLPGPEVQRFIIFLDYNTSNHTWYWTGAQKNPT
jgi:hypothetical protein